MNVGDDLQAILEGFGRPAKSFGQNVVNRHLADFLTSEFKLPISSQVPTR